MTRRSGDGRPAPSRPRLRAVLLGASVDISAVATGLKRHAAVQLKWVGAAPTDAGAPEGVPVLAAASEFLAGAPSAGRFDAIVVATAPATRDIARALVECASRRGVRVLMAERSGARGAYALRPMVLSDVIGPRLGDLDCARARAPVAGQRVLVTGGAGSIGGELVRRIATLGPAHIAVLDNSEFNLFTIEQDLRDAPGTFSRAIRYCDIRDADAVRRAILAERPDIVFHAAAMKHVPIVEQNPCEGVLTNVLGARNVADAVECAGGHLVFVSTDKAVNPANVMGATKRLMEIYFQALDRAAPPGGPRRLVARLGNVLGSAGSVAPLFERQIAQGGPVTITDPDVQRYFITIGQAADFLLEAAAVGLAADDVRGAAHVLEMGAPIRIQDLAEDMIRLAGLAPGREIEVRHIGLRQGEKLREELIADDEEEAATASPGVSVALSPAPPLAEVARRLERVIAAARAGADDHVRALVRDLAASMPAVRAVAG